MRFDFHPLTVRSIDRQTPNAIAITFDLPKEVNGAFDFRPGQYLTLRTSIDGDDIRRTYSICSQPGEDRLRVGVKVIEDGKFSGWADRNLKAGDTIEVMEPEGRFGVELGGAHDYLLIAAGSGITPMLSIAASVLAGEPESTVTLLYGNRTASAIMFLEELEDLKDRFIGRFNIVHLLSREDQDVDILNGRITPEKLIALAKHGLIDPAKADAVLICGPGDLIETTADALKGLGVAGDKIHFERFTPADGSKPRKAPSKAAKAAAAEGVHVEAILDGRKLNFDITSDDTVLAAGLAAGIDLPHSCTAGMCCTCRCRIVEGSGEMDVNYSLRDWELEAGFTLACQTRPTSKKLVLDFDAV